MGGRSKIHNPVLEDKMGSGPVNSAGVFVESVIAELVLDIKQNQNTAGYADGQSGDIEKGIELVASQIPEGYFDVIFQHALLPQILDLPMYTKSCRERFPIWMVLKPGDII
jgi:hypothetical protein